MKNLIVAVAVAAVMTMTSFTLSAAEPAGSSAQNGMISASRLSEMGLGGISVLSDRQAQEIRGQGFVVVFGRSYAGGRSDSYFRVRRHFARGSSFSYGRGTFAGGFAGAYAW